MGELEGSAVTQFQQFHAVVYGRVVRPDPHLIAIAMHNVEIRLPSLNGNRRHIRDIRQHYRVSYGVARIAGIRDQVIARTGLEYVAVGTFAAPEPVTTGAAAQRVVAGAAAQRVMTGAAVEHIALSVAGQSVIVGRADNIFDCAQAVRTAIAVARHRRRQIGGDGSGGRSVGDGIAAAAAIERIIAAAADQRIVAEAARKRVELAIAGEAVGAARADDILDTAYRIGAAVTVARAAGVQIDRHGGGGIGIGNAVVAGTAVQRVITAAADQRIVAEAARKRVELAIAGEAVGAARADDILDTAYRIGAAVTVARAAGVQIDRHGGGGIGIGNAVVAGTAVQRVITGAAIQRIVAEAAGQDIDEIVAAQAIGKIAADDVFDTAQRIRAALAVGGVGGRQIDADGARAADEGQRIRAAAAIDHIVAGAAVQRIVATKPAQLVMAEAAGDIVVAATADQEIIAGRGGIDGGGVAEANGGARRDRIDLENEGDGVIG